MRAGRTERRDVPHDPGQWVEFRTLWAGQLDEAEEVEAKRQLAYTKDISPEVIASIRSEQRDRTIKPIDSYHKPTLLRYAVVGCSECEPCSDEAKQAFDGQTRDWAIDVILEMNVRPLVKDSGSTGTSLTENSHRNSESLTASSSLE